MSDQSDQDEKKSGSRMALGVATGWVIVRHRPYRRNLLFISTLLTLGVVFVGAVFLNGFFSARPVWFALYWIGCFCLVGFVLLLAIYDLIAIRQEHRQRMHSLEKELAEAAEEARELAAKAAEETE